MDGIAAVEARIQEILGSFPNVGGAGGRLGAPATEDDSQTSSFADALSSAQAPTSNTPVPASPGQLNRAGVDPVQWAKDFLTKLGMPITGENVRAIKAWEQAEGTAAHFNPLATTQSGYAGETKFNSVGVKNYVSYDDGLNANVKAIANGLYGPILDALRAGNNANAVASAIANSRWGTGHLVERVLASGA